VDFATLQAGIKTIVANLTTLPAIQVVWFDEAQPAVIGSVQALGRVQIFALRAIGQRDDFVFAEAVPDDDGPLYETVTGIREMTLRVRVETYDQRANLTARFYLETMRKKLQALSTTTSFQALGLGFQSTESLTDISIPVNSRMQSFAALDMKMNGFDSWTDPTTYSRITYPRPAEEGPAVPGIFV
jgi:hypothetical protein